MHFTLKNVLLHHHCIINNHYPVWSSLIIPLHRKYKKVKMKHLAFSYHQYLFRNKTLYHRCEIQAHYGIAFAANSSNTSVPLMPHGTVGDIYLAHMHICIYFKASAHTISVFAALISQGCNWGTQREGIITSAVAILCKLFPLNYSSLTYLSARSWCAVAGFKYWIDFTSNNTGVRAKLHKVTIRQCMTHIQDVSAEL